MGAGHSVTALYEIVPVGKDVELPAIDALKYQTPRQETALSFDDVLTVKVRYKEPSGKESRLLVSAVKAAEAGEGSHNVKLAAAAAAFGMVLRGSEHRGDADYPLVLDLARSARSAHEGDPRGYRAELLQLVNVAKSLASF